MKLSGSYQINLEKQKVWEALNDAEILRKSIPGCEKFIKNSDTEFTATATNKIGPFNASFTGDILLKEIKAPNSYIIEGSGNSPVGFASGEAKVKLEDSEGGTKLSYDVEANVGGKIAQIGSRLIDMTALLVSLMHPHVLGYLQRYHQNLRREQQCLRLLLMRINQILFHDLKKQKNQNLYTF